MSVVHIYMELLHEVTLSLLTSRVYILVQYVRALESLSMTTTLGSQISLGDIQFVTCLQLPAIIQNLPVHQGIPTLVSIIPWRSLWCLTSFLSLDTEIAFGFCCFRVPFENGEIKHYKSPIRIQAFCSFV